jgi:fused signal recognition particle receptor
MSSENKPVSTLGRLFGRGKKQKQEQPQENPAVDSQSPVDSAEQVEHKQPHVNAEAESEAGGRTGLFSRWRSGMGKTRASLGSAFGSLLGGKRSIDDELIEEIETLLLVADVGINTTQNLIDAFRQCVKKGVKADQDLMDVFRELLVETLAVHASPLELGESKPGVVMMVGVNGVGKTTSIGKLAKRFQSQGRSVVLAAGDTFRAAAVEQLQVWGERNSVPVIAQATGADSASVIYDALDSCRARQTDVLIADTAGRLHNKGSLMEELSKIVRVMKKLDESAPHEILLVLDAATGQNALSQAREFCKSVPVTGLVLTKLDGTAKGGIVFALTEQLKVPVKFVGLGEGIDDLTEFDPESFVAALFD